MRDVLQTGYRLLMEFCINTCLIFPLLILGFACFQFLTCRLFRRQKPLWALPSLLTVCVLLPVLFVRTSLGAALFAIWLAVTGAPELLLGLYCGQRYAKTYPGSLDGKWHKGWLTALQGLVALFSLHCLWIVWTGWSGNAW